MSEGMDLFAWADRKRVATLAPQNPRRADAATLPPAFHQVSAVLDRHRGAARAIRAIDIARAIGMLPQGDEDSRRCAVRRIIRQHMDDFPWPVMADSSGFYVPATPDEVAHYDASLMSRIRKTGARLAAFRRQARTAGFDYRGQGRWADRRAAAAVPTP